MEYTLSGEEMNIFAQNLIKIDTQVYLLIVRRTRVLTVSCSCRLLTQRYELSVARRI